MAPSVQPELHNPASMPSPWPAFSAALIESAQGPFGINHCQCDPLLSPVAAPPPLVSAPLLPGAASAQGTSAGLIGSSDLSLPLLLPGPLHQAGVGAVVGFLESKELQPFVKLAAALR